MSKINVGSIKDVIRESLGLDEDNDVIEESYVAQAKDFNLTTELLSSEAKHAHEGLYDQYVHNFNRVSAELDSVDRVSANSNVSPFRSLKEAETYNLNAIYLHELYFSNISDLHSEIAMDSLSYMRLARDFGTFDDWQKDFVACCMSARNGWAVTYYNIYLQRYMNCVIDLHSENVPFGTYPVIVMDMWEHAYYRDYLKDKKTYVYGMMKQFNWKVINRRFEKADNVSKALRM